jgi:nucleoside-diphosphate-sugar epimerase
MATPIAAFNNQLIAFVEELSETYTEEKDLRTALDALKALKRANPKLLHTGFMEYVYPDFHGPVLAEDETTLLSKAHEVLNGEHKDFAFAYLIFDRHWSGMSEANKAAIWKWCKVLVVLAQRAASN